MHPVYREGKQGPERVSNLPRVTKLVGGRARMSQWTTVQAYVTSHLVSVPLSNGDKPAHCEGRYKKVMRKT